MNTSTAKGLTSQQAHSLLKEYGLNLIVGRKQSGIIVKFIEQFKNFLIILLLIAAGFSLYIGEVVDGTLILSIVLLNAIFGVYQENKAEQAVALLQKMTISTVRVMRDGKEQEIDSRELVPGDIFFIEEGVKVPADAKIHEAHNLEVNEAALTGESIPVVKTNNEEVYMGTVASKGRAWVEVTHTGMKTRFGEIAAELSNLQESKTPLQKKLEKVTKVIGIVGIVISLAVFALSTVQGHGYLASFLLAVSLAVALVPEGLPAVMTITLAVGVKDMARKKAIVRKMAAIEALGSISLIATDKTGTLTENDMKVDEIWVDGKSHPITALPPATQHAFKLMTLNGVVCSTASLVFVHDHGKFQVLGDPTEGALLKLAKQVGHEPELLKKEWKLLEEVPFDQQFKRMSVTVEQGKELYTFTKGAPEEILRISSQILSGHTVEKLTEERKEEIMKVLDGWARKGLRVIGFSYSTNAHDLKKPYKDLNDQIFIGLAAIHDPPRVEVRESLQKAFAAGIKVVMITGDNPRTAEAIGKSIGLMQENELILLGSQVEEYTDEQLLEKLPHVRAFARTTPLHKSRIVSLYQKLGEVVAVTGDGVNDAIALKQADVGVAMGLVGTDVARDAADMVITDDNFATIVSAVEEGRNIIKRLKSSIKYLLTGNFAEGMALLLGLALGFPPIFLPIQLLYINLISDGIPALALAFTPTDERVMREKPERDMTLLKSSHIQYIFGIGFVVSTFVVAIYAYYADLGEMISRTAAFSIMAMIQAFIFVDIWFSHRASHHSFKQFFTKLFILTTSVPIIAQLVITQVPDLAEIFHIQALPITQFMFFALISSSVIVVIYVMRRVRRMV